jgi:hypothetical protein
MTPLFNREIIRHLLGSFGMIPPPNFGKVGISTEEYKLSHGFDLEFENDSGEMNKVSFGLWCGLANQGSSTIRVLATDVCDNNYHEFSVVYRVDGAPIHAIKHVFDDESPALFLVKLNTDTGELWKPVGVAEKLIACAGFERFNNLGISWLPCDEYENDLLPALLEVVEM